MSEKNNIVNILITGKPARCRQAKQSGESLTYLDSLVTAFSQNDILISVISDFSKRAV